MRYSQPPPQWTQPPEPGRRPNRERGHPGLAQKLKQTLLMLLVAALALVALVVAGIVGLVTHREPEGPTGVVSWSVITSPTPTRAATSPVVPTAQDNVRGPRCPDGQPALTAQFADAAAGHRYVLVTLRNCSTQPLTLRNSLGVSARTGTGKRLDLVPTRAAKTPHVVAGQGLAYAVFTYTGGGSSDDPDGRVNRVDYTAAEVGTATVLEFSDLAADSSVRVGSWADTPQQAFQGV